MDRTIKILFYSVLILRITGFYSIPWNTSFYSRRIMSPFLEKEDILTITQIFQNYPLEKIKLIVLDYDGTLTENGIVPEEIISLIQRLNKKGYTIAIISLATQHTLSQRVIAQIPSDFNWDKFYIYSRKALARTLFNKGKLLSGLQKQLGLTSENTLIIGDRFGLLGQDRSLLPYGKLVFNVGKHSELDNLINLESKNSQATQLILRIFLEMAAATP